MMQKIEKFMNPWKFIIPVILFCIRPGSYIKMYADVMNSNIKRILRRNRYETHQNMYD